MPDVPETISIRNPRVRSVVGEEMNEHDAGRNAAEAAENLILEAAERRRIDRATRPPVTTERKPVPE